MKAINQISEKLDAIKSSKTHHEENEQLALSINDIDTATAWRNAIENLQRDIDLLEWVLKND